VTILAQLLIRRQSLSKAHREKEQELLKLIKILKLSNFMVSEYKNQANIDVAINQNKFVPAVGTYNTDKALNYISKPRSYK
jgi:hypothetical protein